MPWRRARVLPSGSVGRQAPNPTGRSCVRVALCPDPFPFGRSVHRRSSASTSFVLASLRALHVDPLLGDGGSGAQGEMGVWDVCKLGRSGEGPEVTQVPCSGMVPSLAGGSSSPTGTRGVPDFATSPSATFASTTTPNCPTPIGGTIPTGGTKCIMHFESIVDAWLSGTPNFGVILRQQNDTASPSNGNIVSFGSFEK